jgi:hypothetical protein
MATEFNTGSFFARWAFAIALVLGTYNPSDYSYASWLPACHGHISGDALADSSTWMKRKAETLRRSIHFAAST